MKKKVFFYASLLPVVVFLFFLPSLFNGFVNWDDPDVILKNHLIKNLSWQGTQTIFVTMWTGQYHRFIPLSMVLFAAEYHFFGTNPLGYHLVSVFVHSLNSLGVFVLIYFLTARARAAFVAALVFGVHPLEVQPVVWIAAGQYPMSTFFFLSSVVLYLYGVRAPLQRTKCETLALTTFLWALLFYSQLAMSLPFVLLAIDYYSRGKICREDVLRKAPFFALALYFGWLALKAAHHVAADYLPFFLNHHLPLFHRFNLSSEALWMYVQKFLIPCPLACFYPTNYYFHGMLFLYSLMGGAVFIFVVVFRQQAGLRTSFLGAAWFLLTIAPFLHIYGVSESIINDRYFYLPSIGILLMLTGVWEALQVEKRAGRVPMEFYLKGAGLLWFTLIIFLSYQQMRIWHDSGRLWTNFISQYPGSADGYISRSDYYLTMNKPQVALRDIGILLKLAPQNAATYQNEGHAFFQLRQWQAEAEAYTKVIELNPNFVQIYVDRGAAFFMLGKDDLALEDFNKALQKDPGEVNALFNRGIVYLYKKEYHRALEDFQKVILIDPMNKKAGAKTVEIEHLLAHHHISLKGSDAKENL